MVQHIATVAFEGVEARPVDVQAQVAPGLPAFTIVGLPDKAVSDASFAAVVKRFGEQGVIDLIAAAGYYSIVSMVLNVDRYPLPDGEQPPLKPLA